MSNLLLPFHSNLCIAVTKRQRRKDVREKLMRENSVPFDDLHKSEIFEWIIFIIEDAFEAHIACLPLHLQK